MAWPRLALWALLAVPGMLMIQRFMSGQALAMELYHPSGETSVRLMILALLPGPLVDAFGPRPVLRAWLKIRRNLGVAAFLYAALHLVFYVLDMQVLAVMVSELALSGIWTGWLALGALAVPAAISFDAALRRLGARRWKRLQRFVYPAFLLTLAHWFLLEREWLPALAHLTPLALAWSARALFRTPFHPRRTA